MLLKRTSETRSLLKVPPSTDEKTSALLRRVISELSSEEGSIGRILIQLRRRSFGEMLIFLAVFGLVPGISILAGLVMIIPGLQMIAGFHAP